MTHGGDSRAVIVQLPEGSIDPDLTTSRPSLGAPYVPAGHRRKQLKRAFKRGADCDRPQ